MVQKLHKLDILGYLNDLVYSHLCIRYPEISFSNPVTFSNRPDLGQFQSNVAFTITKSNNEKKRNPIEVAQELISIISRINEITLIKEVGGFINFSLSKEFLIKFLGNLLEEDTYVVSNIRQEKILIDFGGPNIAKAMHVGHLRSSIIGDALQRIYRFFGHEVISDIHLGDWGLPIGMIIMKLEEDYPELKTSEITDNILDIININLLEEIYPIAAAKCKNDPYLRQIAQKITMELQQGNERYHKIWQKIISVSIASLKKNYENLNVNFDLWYGESHVNDLIPKLLKELQDNKNAYVSEGAIIADTSYEAPLVLVNSEGGVTYGMTDIATIYDRVKNLQVNKIIYVVDKRQSLHFKQVFEIAIRSFNFKDLELKHIGFGTLNGKDGKPFKTREGGVMKLEDLFSLVKNKVTEKMQEGGRSQDIEKIASIIGIAALKFADLSKYRLTDYIFDVDQFTEFNGRTGPYLVYSCVRIKAILDKASELDYNIGAIDCLPDIPEINDLNNNLLKFYYYLQKSYLENAPHYLCEHLYNVAQSFSSFYNSINILHHSNLNERSALLGLCKMVLINLEKGLELLGINAMEVTYM